MKKKVFLIFSIFLLIFGISLALKDQIQNIFFAPRSSTMKEGFKLNGVEIEAEKPDIEIIAENLKIPWEIAFLPDGQMLVTERPGTLVKIYKEKHVIQKIEGVEHTGEGGLLGLAVHPDFSENGWIYLYLTLKVKSGLINRVERYRLENNKLFDKRIILEGIAGASFHDGGRMEFGPDGYLYITTGDARNKPLAQDISSLNGKILRIKDDGGVADDNPFGNAVYSYGHRNPQGLAWDESGRLWATEHGPSGLNSGFDEVNLIEKGKNYGWPEIIGDESKEGMTVPVIQSGTDDTWAPAGMAYWKGSFFFAGLRGESLYEAGLTDQDTIILTSHFKEEFGRLRAVVLGPDNYLYITTSNIDGRGTAREGDDKIIRINPQILIGN
jgi:glucose/arabinose dehydrogenase